MSFNMNGLPVDDADHAVFAVIGAVDTKFVQQVEQQQAKVTVKLANSRLKACVGLEAIHVFS